MGGARCYGLCASKKKQSTLGHRKSLPLPLQKRVQAKTRARRIEDRESKAPRFTQRITLQDLALKKEALSFFLPSARLLFLRFEIDELSLVGAAIYFAGPGVNHIHCADENPGTREDFIGFRSFRP
jgi:hypothetical protein